MELVCKSLQSKGVKANLKLNTNYPLCIVEGIDSVCNDLIYKNSGKHSNTQQFGVLVNLDSRNLLHIQHLIIKTLYSIDNNRDLPIELRSMDLMRYLKTKQYVNDKVNKTGQIGWSVYHFHLVLNIFIYLVPSPRGLGERDKSRPGRG